MDMAKLRGVARHDAGIAVAPFVAGAPQARPCEHGFSRDRQPRLCHASGRPYRLSEACRWYQAPIVGLDGPAPPETPQFVEAGIVHGLGLERLALLALQHHREAPGHLIQHSLAILQADHPGGVLGVHRIGSGIILAQHLGAEMVLYALALARLISVAHAERLRGVGVAVNIPRSISASKYHYV